MNETLGIWIALIIAAVIIVALIIYRKQLSRLIFKINREGIDAELDTHAPTQTAGETPAAAARGVSVSGNVLRGKRNRLDVRHTDATVDKNRLIGEDETLTVATPDPRVAYLHQYITHNFSVNDLRTLSQHLHLHYDALPGTTLEVKAQALLEQVQQQEQLPALVAAGRELHPELPWED